jgi:hypothetical protein
MHDTDCSAGEVCACHGSAFLTGGNACIAGNCRVDSDCGPGSFCSPSMSPNCGGLLGYFCHTPQDQCVNDIDCTGYGPQVCTYSTSSASWQCAMFWGCG